MDSHSIIRGTHKDVRPYLREIVARGGTLRISGGNHIIIRLGGYQRVIPNTPRSSRHPVHDMKNLIKNFDEGTLPEPIRAEQSPSQKKRKKNNKL
jgi:hypothetical protein